MRPARVKKTEKKIGFQSGQTRFSYQQQQRSTMSFVIKRELSSLIPPKIASAKVCDIALVGIVIEMGI